MFGNWLKTTLLMSAIVALFGVIGAALCGASGMMIALLIATAMNVWAYWFSDSLVLRMYHAREVDDISAPDFYRMVRDLAQRANLPCPKIYIIDETQPNAFATGRNPQHAAVAATTGIIRLLSERELRGVMAHELAHIRNRDTLISTISATAAGAISVLANFALLFSGGQRSGERGVHPFIALLVMLFAPLAAMLIQMAISRTREFGADAGGAEISGEPLALASALEKIEHYARGLPLAAAEQHPETAQMMIINPLSGEGISNLFRTHPKTAERIARLQQIALSQ